MFNLEGKIKWYYIDDENDIISITNQKDFEEALLVNPDRIIVADNIQKAREEIGISNLQRSELLNQSLIMRKSTYSQKPKVVQPVPIVESAKIEPDIVNQE